MLTLTLKVSPKDKSLFKCKHLKGLIPGPETRRYTHPSPFKGRLRSEVQTFAAILIKKSNHFFLLAHKTIPVYEPILCTLAALFYYVEFHKPQSMTRLLGAFVGDILKGPGAFFSPTLPFLFWLSPHFHASKIPFLVFVFSPTPRKRLLRRLVSRKPRKLFGPVNPFLVHLYLKTETCIGLKLLVWRESLFILLRLSITCAL